MSKSVIFPESGYSEDVQASESWARFASDEGNKVGMALKIGTTLFWVPWLLKLLGAIPDQAKWLFWAPMLFGVTICLVGFVLHSRRMITRSVMCGGCGNRTKRIEHQSCEFFVCDGCRLYSRGGDFS